MAESEPMYEYVHTKYLRSMTRKSEKALKKGRHEKMKSMHVTSTR